MTFLALRADSANDLLLGEGFILSTFRNGEAIAPTPVDKKMFRLVMQYEARHVTYGMMHLKYFLCENPGRAEVR